MSGAIISGYLFIAFLCAGWFYAGWQREFWQISDNLDDRVTDGILSLLGALLWPVMAFVFIALFGHRHGWALPFSRAAAPPAKPPQTSSPSRSPMNAFRQGRSARTGLNESLFGSSTRANDTALSCVLAAFSRPADRGSA